MGKQEELDIAEEYILTRLFGSTTKPIISKKIQFFCIAKNFNLMDYINKQLNTFEEFAKDFMTDEGLFEGNKVAEAIALKFPVFLGLSIPNFKPMELVALIDYFVSFETIGKWIQNL